MLTTIFIAVASIAILTLPVIAIVTDVVHAIQNTSNPIDFS